MTADPDEIIQVFGHWDSQVSALQRADDPTQRVIISYGFPGSGSTVMWQILDFLFGNVKKTASCPRYRDNSYIVATVRDFRDVLCTYLQRTGMRVSKADIDTLIKTIAQDEAVFSELDLIHQVWKPTDGHILWLRYEDFFDNYAHIFDRLALFLDRHVTAQERDHISARFSLEANRQRAQKARALSTLDETRSWLEIESQSVVVDGINAKHITSDGTPGKWKQIIPEALHEYITDLLHEPLHRFGYV